MFNINSLVRSNIKKLSPYSSARDEFKGDEGIFLDANENPFGTYNRYPDPYQIKLKGLISETKDVKLENLFLGNGSDEIIDLLFRIFCEPGMDKALCFTPTYGMYEVSASINDVELLTIPLKDNFQIDIEKSRPLLTDPQIKLLFLCSPNNPTGNSIYENDIEFILNEFKGLVVIDEAYIDFSPQKSYSGMINKYLNLVVLQTLSKAWGLAGARLGMAFSNVEIIKYLNKVKPPYNISTLSQEIAIEAFQNKVLFEDKISLINAEKAKLITELSRIGLVETIYPSDANFLLVKFKDADKIYKQLITKKLIVRNRSKVVNNCLRITIGTPEENKLLIQELKR